MTLTAGLSLEWLTSRVLTAPARAEYHRVEAGAWAEYQRVTNATAARLLAEPANWKSGILTTGAR